MHFVNAKKGQKSCEIHKFRKIVTASLSRNCLVVDMSTTEEKPVENYEAPETTPQELEGPSAQEKQWGLIACLSPFAGYIIPLASVVAPLIIWQMKKDELPFAADHAKETLNFEISVFIYIVACIPLCFILIGFPLIFLLGVGNIVFLIIAALKANNGENFRYPLTIRLVK